MKQKILVKILIMFIIIALTLMGSNYANASSFSDILEGADSFLQDGIGDVKDNLNQANLQTMSDMIYNVLLAVAVIAAVIMGLIIGIKFMTGSVDQKAKIKETLIVYIVGCVVAFGTFGIWRLVINIMSQA